MRLNENTQIAGTFYNRLLLLQTYMSSFFNVFWLYDMFLG